MPIWNSLIDFQEELVKIFDKNMLRYDEEDLASFNRSGWTNLTWRSNKFRRAHMEIIDARESNKIWIMHICIFPQLSSGAPIYGFDIIAGPSKITGTFHDFSPINPHHPALAYFEKQAKNASWSRERELPEWAKAIFSPNMIAAGNIKDANEIRQLTELSASTTKWYLEDMICFDSYESSRLSHNKYAHFQKQNPHTPRTLKSLGIPEHDVDFFFNNCLFPEV